MSTYLMQSGFECQTGAKNLLKNPHEFENYAKDILHPTYAITLVQAI